MTKTRIVNVAELALRVEALEALVANLSAQLIPKPSASWFTHRPGCPAMTAAANPGGTGCTCALSVAIDTAGAA